VTATRATARRSLVYVGWQGFANFGDDLLHATWAAALGDVRMVEAPLARRDYLRQLPRYLRDVVRLGRGERCILLGGGTTIGFGNWAGHLSLAVRRFRASRIIIPGAGAAESTDAFALSLQEQAWAGWRALPATLLGVRGPLTARECERHWQPTEVIGDPALLYPRYVPITPTERTQRGRVIGVCVGADPQSRFDPTVLATALHQHAGDDAHIRIVQLSTADEHAVNALANALGGRVERVRYDGDVPAVMQAIAGCDLFISERLHGAVAAVALHVPTVPLAYASKCDDFWLSVAGVRAPVRVGHTAADLTDAIDHALTPSTIAAVTVRVADLQEHLTASAELIRSWATGTRTTADLLDGGPAS
jgi:hypothetical protein